MFGVSSISFGVIALVGKGSMRQKACENLPGVGIRLYGKFEINAYRNVSIVPGHIDRQTDPLFLM